MTNVYAINGLHRKYQKWHLFTVQDNMHKLKMQWITAHILKPNYATYPKLTWKLSF